jgi:endonuclease/exonuclease/phosphatase family metal-dependent hydrolase
MTDESFRVASFNAENLFGRAKVLNMQDNTVGDQVLKEINDLQMLLKKAKYEAEDKERILQLYNDLKEYIEILEDRGKLFKRDGFAIKGVKADGSGDWDGTIEFKRAKYSELTRENTAKVIKDTKADLACIVEVESRLALTSFDAHLLGSKYKYEILLDGNDTRGIDVGLYSNYPIGGIWTHIFDKDGNKTIFSRDCLEVEVFLDSNQPLYVLCNHFKSRGYDSEGNADEKRKRQAKRVAQILDKYNLENDWVVVAGDLNDNPSSAALKDLLTVPHMYDVLELRYPDNSSKRWTYHYDQFEQIDFILVSEPLKQRILNAGVWRRGIYNLKKMTSASNGQVDIEDEYDTVTHWTNAASDHGAVWAEFRV